MKIHIEIDPSPFDGNKRRQEVKDRLGGKKSKKEVDYRKAEGDTKSICINCVNYVDKKQPVSPCKKVAGEVEAKDVCDIFEPSTDGQGHEVQPSKDK